MNALTVPPAPNWYESNILACAPDNTLIYGARTDIVILKNSDDDVPSDVSIISRAHVQKITCVNINRNWGKPRKLIVSSAEDKVVKVWNVETCKKLYSHNKHISDDKVIGVTFAGDERIISVSEAGQIVIWNVGLNETNSIKELLGPKVVVTCISTCPHATWLTGFGLKNGLVIVADLRKNGKLLFKMRGHDKSVISLSWCPVPINIFPKHPQNFVGQRKVDIANEEMVHSIESQSQENIETEIFCHPLLRMYGYDEDDTKYLQKYLLKECYILEHEVLGRDNQSSNQNSNIEEIKETDSLDEIKLDEVPFNTENECNESVHIDETKKSLESANLVDTSEECSKCEKSQETLLKNIVNINEEVEKQVNVSSEGINYTSCSDVGRNIVTKMVVEEEPRKEFLLASSAKEGNIYIWRAGTDGRMQTILTLPNKSGHRKYKSPVDKIWITLCWISPTVLLSSSKSSELLAWALPKPPDASKVFSVINNDHTSLLFSIAAPIHLRNEDNWKEVVDMNAWTTSQDRQLINTSINGVKANLAYYPTIGGSIQCMQLSPLDPNRLAIGTMDGFIRFWDLSRPHTKKINMTSFYNKIQSKVSAISWHPVNELLLAFGTSEGRIGCLDTSNKSKSPSILPPFFKSEVYKLEWGPVRGNQKNLGLYALGEGSLVLFDFSKAIKEPVEIDKPDNTFIYSFAWKPDYSLLILVTKNGFLIIYSPDLKIICKHYFQYRINDIIWHPNAASAGTKESNWFASISNAKSVIVYNFDVESGNNDKNIINTYCTSDLVNGVAWSPYDSSHIVIACEVGVAQVWNVHTNEILSTFVNPNFDSILSVIWSPIDSNFIISSGKDNSLRIWKVSDYPPLSEKEISKQKKKVSKESPAETAILAVQPEPPVEAKVKKPVKKSLLPKQYSPKNISETVSDFKKLLLWKENPSLVEANVGDTSEVDILNFFGSNDAMMNLINMNESIHRERGKYNFNTKLSLFKGDISTSLKEAIDEKRVDLGIISLAPMVSPKLWKAACETYADQLSDDLNSDPLEVATYYLVCHNVNRAIECLCGASLFKEAIALAKCRMMGADVVSDIIQKWATYSLQTGNFEVAAQCNIFLGKYDEAASVLFRRNDLEYLQFAVDLAEKAGNVELREAILFRLDAFKNDGGKADIDLLTKEEVFLDNETRPEIGDDTKVANGIKEIIEPVDTKKNITKEEIIKDDLHTEMINTTEE